MVFLMVDLLWLKYIAGPFYQSSLGDLLSDSPRMTPALIFYLLFVLGNCWFVVRPALEAQMMVKIWFPGVLYGLISYGTYDLTNYSALKNWPLSVTVIDISWGILISCFTALVGYYSGILLQKSL